MPQARFFNPRGKEVFPPRQVNFAADRDSDVSCLHIIIAGAGQFLSRLDVPLDHRRVPIAPDGVADFVHVPGFYSAEHFPEAGIADLVGGDTEGDGSMISTPEAVSLHDLQAAHAGSQIASRTNGHTPSRGLTAAEFSALEIEADRLKRENESRLARHGIGAVDPSLLDQLIAGAAGQPITLKNLGKAIVHIEPWGGCTPRAAQECLDRLAVERAVRARQAVDDTLAIQRIAELPGLLPHATTASEWFGLRHEQLVLCGMNSSDAVQRAEQEMLDGCLGMEAGKADAVAGGAPDV